MPATRLQVDLCVSYRVVLGNQQEVDLSMHRDQPLKACNDNDVCIKMDIFSWDTSAEQLVHMTMTLLKAHIRCPYTQRHKAMCGNIADRLHGT